ncbi:MAG TPA: lactonase family protein [Terriglobales bacterium]|nr:lactonase family protein [Terriglobales bacterium]
MHHRFLQSITFGIIGAFISLLVPDHALAQKPNSKNSYLMYVGTYTGPASKGIYAYRFDAGTGQATSLGLVAETVNPSFLAVDPSRRFLYAANEISNYQGEKSGGVSAFAIDQESGKLTFLNEVSSHGAGPCYVSLDKTGKYVMVANYDTGSVAVFPMLPGGTLGEASAVIQHTGHGPDAKRQEGPHAHEIEASPDNRFALAADLGLDEVLVYHFDPAKGTLSANDPPFAKVAPGAGPRHFVFHPSTKFVYVIDEIASTVTAFSYNAVKGTLDQLSAVSTLPEGFKGENDTAEIHVSVDGKFLYGSNRGHNSIAIFALDQATGAPKFVEAVPTGGKTPRNFELAPGGDYLFAANQDSNNIVVFRVDKKTGHLTPTGQVLEAPSPVSLRFVAIK